MVTGDNPDAPVPLKVIVFSPIPTPLVELASLPVIVTFLPQGTEEGKTGFKVSVVDFSNNGTENVPMEEDQYCEEYADEWYSPAVQTREGLEGSTAAPK